MLWKIGTLVVLFLFHVSSFSQDCDRPCASELLRVEIASGVLSNGAAEGLLPALSSLSESDKLKSALEKNFPIPDLPFPHNPQTCESEKAEGDPNFRNINCQALGLCANPGLHPVVRSRICFKLPCALFEGNLNTGKCLEETDIYPTGLSFPGSVTIQKINLSPSKVDYKDGKASLCFKINELDLKMNTTLALDVSNTNLPDNAIEVTDINPVLDSPRELCVNADINIGSANPVANLRITNPDNTPFISDAMIRTASQKLNIRGISGYAAIDLEAIKSEVVPVLFQPIRDSVEKAVQESLSKVFNEKIQQVIEPLTNSSGLTTSVSSNSFISELGLTNIQVKNQLAKTECAYLKAAGREIPPKHACIGLSHFGSPIDQNFDSSAFIERVTLVSMMEGKKITSESIKQRLMALKEIMREEKMSEILTKDREPEELERSLRWHRERIEEDISSEIDPLIEQITNAQLETQLFNFVKIQNQINGDSNSIGLMLPEICSERPSPHAGRKIRNCPIQVYADLNEFNKVLAKMWNTGHLCMKGGGEFVPERDERGRQAYNKEGKPLVRNGCEINLNGMSCYVKSPPEIKYDSRHRRYKVDLKLTNCYRGPVFLGIGKFGGDFNIGFNFEPKACENGDFCMENPQASWSIVPGTERFDLRESSFFDKMIKDKINDAVTNAVKDTIRIPMASGVGPLGNVPLQAEGRIDSGPGFFGVCLEVPKGASAQ